MKLWFQVIETKVSSLWNQSFNRLKLLETTGNDFFTLAHPEMKRTPIIEWQAAVSKDKGDNKKHSSVIITLLSPSIITLYSFVIKELIFKSDK